MTTENNGLPHKKKKRAKYILNIDKIPQLTELEKEKIKEVSKRYVFRTNDYYLSLINWDDPDDPIRRLIIPHEEELIEWGKLDASDEEAVQLKEESSTNTPQPYYCL